jgi:hypothetical protein
LFWSLAVRASASFSTLQREMSSRHGGSREITEKGFPGESEKFDPFMVNGFFRFQHRLESTPE